jgi:hypothetical protein
VWEHYAVTYDRAGGLAKIFRNGVQVASGVFLDDPPIERWVFGHNSDVGNHNDTLRGKLDELLVYDMLLTHEEIELLAGGVRLDDLTLSSDADSRRRKHDDQWQLHRRHSVRRAHGADRLGDGTAPTELSIEGDQQFSRTIPTPTTRRVDSTTIKSPSRARQRHISDQGSLVISVANVARGPNRRPANWCELPETCRLCSPPAIRLVDQSADSRLRSIGMGTTCSTNHSAARAAGAVHAYDTGGAYQIQVLLTRMEESAIISHMVAIQDLALPIVLLVGGTPGTITSVPAWVERAWPSCGTARQPAHSARSSGFRHTGDGNDLLIAAAGLAIPALFSGGENDTLTGARQRGVC